MRRGVLELVPEFPIVIIDLLAQDSKQQQILGCDDCPSDNIRLPLSLGCWRVGRGLPSCRSRLVAVLSHRLTTIVIVVSLSLTEALWGETHGLRVLQQCAHSVGGSVWRIAAALAKKIDVAFQFRVL